MGAEVGLKPDEIWDMELWEFNNYQLGYRNYIKQKEKDIVKTAYYTAVFVRSKKNKKLSTYLKQIDSENNPKKAKNKEKLKFAREMDEKISKINRIDK